MKDRDKQLAEQEEAILNTPQHGNSSELSKLPNKRPAPNSDKPSAMSIDDLLKPVKRAEDR